MDSITFNKKFNQIPLLIREHFGSEAVVDVIGKINESLGIKEEDEKRQRIIPRLLLRLEIKDIEPQKFTGEMAAELSLEKNKALSLSHEILRLILLPVKNDLREYGVDINLLEKFEMPAIKLIKHEPPAVLKDSDIEKAAQEPAEKFSAVPSPVKIDSGSVVNLKPPAVSKEEEAPMILHKEESEVKVLPGAKTSGMGGLFGFFKKKPAQSPELNQVAAKIQLSFNPADEKKAKEPEVAKTAAPKIKVIHYSEFNPPPADVFGKEAVGGKTGVEQKPVPMPITPVRQEQKEIKKIDFEPKIIRPEPPKEIKTPPPFQLKEEKPSFISSPPKQNFGVFQAPSSPVIKQEKEISEIKLEPKVIDFSPPQPSPKPAPKLAEPPPLPKPEHEIKLEDVPVGEDIVDLRNIDRVKKSTDK